MTAISTVEDVTPVWFVAEHDPARSDANVDTLLNAAQELGYDMVTVPITTSTFARHVYSSLQGHLQQKSDGTPPILLQPLDESHTMLSPSDATGRLVGIVSPWIVLGAKNPDVAAVSRQVLKLELAYAAFCGITNIIVHGPAEGSDVTEFSRCILEGLSAGPYLNIRIVLPMDGELEDCDMAERSLLELVPDLNGEMMQDLDGEMMDEDCESLNSWRVWNTIRSTCDYNSRLGIVLEVPRRLPSLRLQSRWYSEPVRFLSFPRTSFMRNAKGYPVLHKTLQEFLTRMQRLRFPPYLILSDATEPALTDATAAKVDNLTPAEAASLQKPKHRASHLQYLRHLQQSQPPRPAIERFGQGYQDYMQSPLQPLTDNLESITYEVFEKDPVKYDWYEDATRLALLDLKARLGDARPFNVAVVGSGRGPLVSKALLASQSSGVPIRCWAVEKNPNAYVHLLKRNQSDPLWNGQVTVVKTDMRAWQSPLIDGSLQKLDVMISELLGSFADNELSPECLDGVQHVLHPEHGINIPQSYSAHLTPISTPRLYNDLLSRPGDDKWEIPVVVMLQQLDYLSFDKTSSVLPVVETAWSFRHPINTTLLQRQKTRAGGSAVLGGPGGAYGGDGSNEHNNRYCKVTFDCDLQGVCHGLAGYFESVLYKSSSGKAVELSTNPVTMDAKSNDMISWFPIFFPIKTPIQIPSKSCVTVSMWRMTDDRKVWYEWQVQVSDANDKKRVVAISELHSSRKNGCLM